jgi:hypothetical protein
MRSGPRADTLRAMRIAPPSEGRCTPPRGPGRRRALPAVLLALALATPGCSSKSPTGPAPGAATRSWRMGFSANPPVPDQAIALQAIDLWSQRADVAIQHENPPFDSLLAGVPADTLVRRHQYPLMNYFRNVKGHRIVFEVDLTNGLDRSAEDPQLVAAGRSLSEPAVRALACAWIAAVDTIVHPDWLGIGSETNLVRLAAPAAVYAALRTAANEAADTLAALHAARPSLPQPVLYSSVQVETAWGRLGGGGAYRGIATDLADFPYAQVVGLSSYPYLGGFAEPEDVPLDYFSRLAGEAAKPVLVVEGGWASQSFTGFTTTPAKQARYVRRQALLLDAARAQAWCSLEFADLAVSLWPGTIDPAIRYFTSLGVVDSVLAPKPSLGAWDSLYARPRSP